MEYFVQRDNKTGKVLATEATNTFSSCDLVVEVGEEVPENLTYSEQGHSGKFVNVLNGTFQCITDTPKYPALDSSPTE